MIAAADGRQSHVTSHHRRHHHRTHVSSNSNYFTYLYHEIEESLWLHWEDCQSHEQFTTGEDHTLLPLLYRYGQVPPETTKFPQILPELSTKQGIPLQNGTGSKVLPTIIPPVKLVSFKIYTIILITFSIIRNNRRITENMALVAHTLLIYHPLVNIKVIPIYNKVNTH